MLEGTSPIDPRLGRACLEDASLDDASAADACPDGAAMPSAWTPDHVAARLVEAFRTLDRMPRVRGPRGAGNHWPGHVVDAADRIAQAELPEAERRERDARRNALALRPGGAAIDRMDKSLDWLRLLRAERPDLAELVGFWAVRAARGRSVRALCRERGWMPTTFYRHRAEALAWPAATLEAMAVPVF